MQQQRYSLQQRIGSAHGRSHGLVPRLRQALTVSVLVVASLMCPSPGQAFWVVNFGTAKTLPIRKAGFAAGMGGQMVFAGDPTEKNGFFLIPHAGFRLGFASRFDMGFRLAPVPLPFSTVGPGFGANIDGKLRLTRADSAIQLALVVGAGGAHVLVRDDHRAAWSPNGAALLTFMADQTVQLTLMARYVYLAIPTAKGGGSKNNVQIAGASAGLKFDLWPTVSLLPEVGAYWYEGRLAGADMSGPGFQYGLMLATVF